jgi:hypothetical protein
MFSSSTEEIFLLHTFFHAMKKQSMDGGEGRIRTHYEVPEKNLKSRRKAKTTTSALKTGNGCGRKRKTNSNTEKEK